MRAAGRCASLLLVGLGLAGGGCGFIPRNGIADAAVAERAQVAGLPHVRFWGDEVPPDVPAAVRRAAPGLPRFAQAAVGADGRPLVRILALSGGGPDGAFGAGVLAGWSRRGDRPQFEIVTGVSAGGIIAPFAFLGPRYDKQLRQIWTEYQTSQILIAQIVPGLLGGPALADTTPLAKLIETFVDERTLREIAAEYRKGRLLLVGTTNLDAQRPVVWNMGEIAASGHPDAAVLFRRVLLASAAIPGAFPPVNIDVEVAGQPFEEMHVDGATTREVFVTPVPVALRAFDFLYPAPPVRRIYIIKNGKIAPESQVVPPQAIPIAARAISTLIKSQHLGDVYRIYRMARDAGADFNLIAVPTTFREKPSQFIDPAYQTALFELGFEMGRTGKGWAKLAPELRTVAR